MLFSPSAFYQNQTFGATVGTVLDRHTGTIWAMLTVSDLSAPDLPLGLCTVLLYCICLILRRTNTATPNVGQQYLPSNHEQYGPRDHLDSAEGHFEEYQSTRSWLGVHNGLRCSAGIRPASNSDGLYTWAVVLVSNYSRAQ